MSNYYLIILWIAFFAFMGMFIQMKRSEVVCGRDVKRMQPFWATVLVAPLVLWTANRGYVGDTYAYMDSFAQMPTGISGIAEYMAGMDKDRGFYFVSALIKILITDNVNVYLFIMGAVQAYLLFRLYRKYSSQYVISFFLFIASSDYISWMFNGMRQFTAVTITLLAFEFILDKKYAKAIIVILIASLFHQSALLMIPFVFVVQGQAWNRKTLLFILLIIVAIASVEQFTDILDTALKETQYKDVMGTAVEWQDDGTNALRVIVYAVPTILSLIGLKYIKAKDKNLINICTNMSIISTGLYVVSMFTSGIYIGRLPIYFSLYNYILLTWEIDHIFEKKSSKLLYIAMVVAYLGFYIYQIRFAWGLV